MLTDTNAAERIGQKIQQEDANLFEKIVNWFKGIAEKLRKAYEGMNPDSDIAKSAKKTIQQVDSLVEMWADMAVEAAGNYRNAVSNDGVTDLGDDVMYANRSFADQVDEVRNKTFDKNNHVFVCNTPRKISQTLSIPVLPVLMSSTHVYTMALDRATAAAENRSVKKKNFHDLGWDFVKKFPEIIKNPAALIKSTTDPNDCRFVVVTHEVDKLQRLVIAAMIPSGKGNFYNLEMVDVGLLSGYGADDFRDYIASAKTENRILYVQKNQTNKNTTGNLFSNNILSSNYSDNLSQFKKIVKSQFDGTVFQNTFDDDGDRLFSDRDSNYMDLAKDPEKNRDQLQQMVNQAAKDAGYTDRMWHGTPYGGFTKFKEWSYFTPHQEYADRYQNPGASSIRGRYNPATNPQTCGVFVKAENAFDTRKKKYRDLFNREFYRQWGNGAPLSEMGLPDWTDGSDLVEFLEENDYDFDAIYLDEGADGGYGEEVRKRGLTAAPRSSCADGLTTHP